jgi:RNA polymerase sigma-70 factor, ECF subfamily
MYGLRWRASWPTWLCASECKLSASPVIKWVMPLPQLDPPTNSLSDAQLAAEVAHGNGEALALLYERHARELLAVAYHLLQSTADAEDVVHDVFVGLPEALRRYQERGALVAWLRKVTARVALMRMRQDELHRTELLDDASIAATANMPDDVVTIERALRRLSPALRAVLVLKEIEGFTHAEIAAMLDISIAASEVRLHRALRILRAILIPDKNL